MPALPAAQCQATTACSSCRTMSGHYCLLFLPHNARPLLPARLPTSPIRSVSQSWHCFTGSPVSPSSYHKSHNLTSPAFPAQLRFTSPSAAWRAGHVSFSQHVQLPCLILSAPHLTPTCILRNRIYRVSIKSFPDYKHLLQENHVKYKHIFLPLLKSVVKKLLELH